MKTTGKLITSYLIMALVVIALGLYSLYAVYNINQNAKSMYEDRTIPLAQLTNISHMMENTRVLMLKGLLSEDQNSGQLIEENVNEINYLIAEFETLEQTQEEEDVFDSLLANWNTFAAMVYEDIRNLSDGTVLDVTEAQQRFITSDEIFALVSEDLTILTELNTKFSAEINEENANMFQSTTTQMIIVIIISVILAIVIGILMGRHINRPLQKLNTRISEIANRDLQSEPLRTRRSDEFGILMNQTNIMQEHLKKIINQVTETTSQVKSSSAELAQSADEVRNGSEQISTTMEELASGAEQQARLASDLSSNMSDFTVTIATTAENGEKLNTNSQEIIDLTTEGERKMQSSVAQMELINHVVHDSVTEVSELDTETREVSKLVAVIQDVADQTNLLALNASIEAARAGEAGKGFTVVAEEVRTLAEQTSTSVIEITNIINNIQTKSTNVVKSLESGYKEVQAGTEQIQDTQSTFGDISKAIQFISTSINAATTTLRNISEATKEMSINVEEIASVSEQSAAGIEQTTASSEQSTSIMEEISRSADALAKLADDLSDMLQTFKY